MKRLLSLICVVFLTTAFVAPTVYAATQQSLKKISLEKQDDKNGSGTTSSDCDPDKDGKCD